MADNGPSSSELLRRAGAGDGQALGERFDQYRDRLRRMVQLRLDRRLQGRLDPSDVLQEAYVEVAKSLAEYCTLTLNGSGSGLDILDFFDQNNPNAETYNFDAVPSNLTLMTVPVSINFNGFAGTSVYLETNGFSTVNDASGQVNVDVPPPCLPDTGPDQAVLAQVLVEAAQKQGALPRNAPPVTEAMADDLVAHAAKMPDPWALLDWSA